MRILCVCDKGVNRSVHIASELKWAGHDTVPVGVHTAQPGTLTMLAGWADLIIATDEKQIEAIAEHVRGPLPIWLWEIRDGYSRPYNAVQHKLVRRHIDEHRERLIHLDGA